MQRSTGTLVIFPERASGFQAVRLASVVVMFLLVFAAVHLPRIVESPPERIQL
jgi:hypothetical protein